MRRCEEEEDRTDGRRVDTRRNRRIREIDKIVKMKGFVSERERSLFDEMEDEIVVAHRRYTE